MARKIEYGGYALEERLNYNKMYGTADVAEWILGLLKPRPGERILDVGCGYGQNALEYKARVGPLGEVIGTDISGAFITRARSEIHGLGGLRFLVHDASKPFRLQSDYFNAITCNFAIYHIPNASGCVAEFHRMLRKGGRVLITGPDRMNNSTLYQLHKLAGGTVRIAMARETFRDQTSKYLKKYFKKVQYSVFENRVIFPSALDLHNYYADTMLFLANTPKNERKNVLDRLDRVLGPQKPIENTKVVGALLAWK